MSVIVLTSASGISDDDLKAASEASGAAFSRLGDCGAEGAGDAAAAARVAEAAPGADVNAVPRSGREKSLLIADMDSTIISVECIDEIADVAGVGAEVAGITDAAMRGELDFEDALRARVALLDGLEVSRLEEVWRERVRLNPGAQTAVRTMAGRGAVTALVSGGFAFFAEKVAAAAGFGIAQANGLEEKDGRLTGRPAGPILGREAKRDALLRLCAEAGIAPAGALAVGDGANDLAMVEAAGLGVAYKAKPALAEAADARLERSDLTALLFLQGIPEAEFAR
ncbi:MAG: phosphoserine phosphatase SerB [Pseudomonadota bacterium]